MSTPDQPEPSSSPDLDPAIEQEIRRGRQFSMAEAIGQAGGSFLKGDSPVPKLVQVKTELIGFINLHLHDSAGALQATLHDLVRSDDEVCSRHFAMPLLALEDLLRPLVSHEAYLRDFVRRVDMRWGQMYGERPHFERPGKPPHPDDEYTLVSVRSQLTQLLTVAQQHCAS